MEIGKNKITLTLLLLTLIGLLINQSGIIMGVNFSFSDIFLSIVVFVLLIRKQFYFYRNHILFFLGLLINVLLVGSIVNNIFLNSNVSGMSFIREITKLCVLFLYLALGYNSAKLGLSNILLKSFFIGSVIISFLSILYFLIPISFLRETLFLGANRFKGLMNDPNYFSVIQLVALVYLFEQNSLNYIRKIAFTFVIVISILFSGSKTGLIGLLIVSIIIFLSNIISSEKTTRSVIGITVVISFAVPLFIYLFSYDILEEISRIHPSFERVYGVITNFNSAINEGGSGRGRAWGQAVELIKISPIFGIGIGTYGKLNMLISGSRTIAHNTYLQLIIEWGSIFTLIFGVAIGRLIFYSFKIKKNLNLQTSRKMLLPFAIGSVSISLNNARLFWILLGIFFYFTTNNIDEI